MHRVPQFGSYDVWRTHKRSMERKERNASWFCLDGALETNSDPPVGCNPQSVQMNVPCYANNILFMASSETALQDMLDRLAALIDSYRSWA